MTKNGVFYFSILEYFLSFLRYSSFCSKIDDVINCANACNKSQNIFENIGWMLFKLGTSNVHQIRQKVTPLRHVAMATLSFPVPLCNEPNISDIEQISTGRLSDLKHMCYP